MRPLTSPRACEAARGREPPLLPLPLCSGRDPSRGPLTPHGAAAAALVRGRAPRNDRHTAVTRHRRSPPAGPLLPNPPVLLGCFTPFTDSVSVTACPVAAASNSQTLLRSSFSGGCVTDQSRTRSCTGLLVWKLPVMVSRPTSPRRLSQPCLGGATGAAGHEPPLPRHVRREPDVPHPTALPRYSVPPSPIPFSLLDG